MTKDKFIEILKKVSTQETSFNPSGWTENNPLWGHCAIAALLAQDYFGGEIMKGSLKGNDKYKYLKSHFWNRLPEGREVDFTKDQYTDLEFKDLYGENEEREKVLAYKGTTERYITLRKAFISYLN